VLATEVVEESLVMFPAALGVLVASKERPPCPASYRLPSGW
jgi:hypothetical protein